MATKKNSSVRTNSPEPPGKKTTSGKSKPANPKVKPWDAVSLNPTAPGKKKTSAATMQKEIKKWQPGHSAFFR